MRGRPRKRIKIICKSCGKEFETCPCRTKKNNGKYCSLKCLWISKIGKPTWNKGKELPRGEKSFAWKGGRVVKTDGYIYIRHIPGHYMLEHRKVMEDRIGRKRKKDEVGHHIDENRANNKIENLMLMKLVDHISLHHIKTLFKEEL